MKGLNFKKDEMKELLEGESKSKYLALLVLGVLIGVIFKAQAFKIITVGYEDYKLSSIKDDFSVEKIKEPEPEFTTEQAESQSNPTQQEDGVEEIIQ